MCPCPQEKTEQENKANSGEVSAGWSLMTTTSSSQEVYGGQNLMGKKQGLPVICFPINVVLYFT